MAEMTRPTRIETWRGKELNTLCDDSFRSPASTNNYDEKPGGMVVKQKTSETDSLLKLQVHMLTATATETHEEDNLHVPRP